MVISQILTPKAHIWETRSWEIYPPQMAISQISNLRVYIWHTRSWQIFHPHQTLISQIPILIAHIWHTRCWGLGRSTPLNGNFTDPFSKTSYLADQVLADLPPWNGHVTDSYSESSYLADQVLGDLNSQMTMSQIPNLRTYIWRTRSWLIFHPPPNSDFTDSHSDSSYLADQVLADLPPSNGNFTDSYSEKSLFGRSGLDISTPIPHSNFTDSYSESSYLADQVLADLLSQMAISQIPTLRGHIWQTRSW